MAVNPPEDNVFMNSSGDTPASSHALYNNTDHQPGALRFGSPSFGSTAATQPDEHLAQLPTPHSAALESSLSTSGRKQHFRKLVSDIAEHLDQIDVDKVIWQKELPQKMKDKPALSVLEWLYNHGDFSMNELRPLTQLLKEIHREDLLEKVEAFQEKFGRHSSLPLSSPKPHFSNEKRSFTLSGDQTPLTQVIDATPNPEKSPQQESNDCDDSNLQSLNSSRVQRQRNGRSVSSGPSVSEVLSMSTAEESLQHSMEEPFVDPAPMSHDQMPQSHDQSFQSHDHSPRLNSIMQSEASQRHVRTKHMPKQASFDQIEYNNAPPPAVEGRRIHRSSSSNTTNVVVRPLEVHPLGSGNISDLHHNPICGQTAWRFNSNPSSGNVSQENILASSHSDVSIPTSYPRGSVRPLPPPYHQRAGSNSHRYSQDHQGVSYHPQSPGAYHAVNQQMSQSGFHVGDFNEPSTYAGHNYYPAHHHSHCVHSLSQSAGCQYCSVQPHSYVNQQNCSQNHSQEHVIASVHAPHNPPNHHYRQSSGCNCVTDSRCASRSSMRQLQVITPQPPPQSFPTAYPSTQNIAQQQFHLSFTTPTSRHLKQPPTRHLSLMNQPDHSQGPHVGHRYSGYGTDGSGDEVFHSYTGGDHLLAAPERSHSHPKSGSNVNTTSKTAKPQKRQNSHDTGLSDYTETTASRRAAAVQSGVRGSEVSMEIPYVGPAIVEKNHSKRVWDPTSHSSELNDSDSGFTGSAPHGINGDTTKRSFTPSTSAKLHNELKKLLPQSPTVMNSLSSSKGAMAENAKPFEQLKRKSPPISRDQEEDTLSDDNIPVVYKDDENDARWTKRGNGRTIVRNAPQYRSLRYERDRQIHRRKPNRSSLQSFDGNVLDTVDQGSRPRHHSTKSQGTINGSSHSLKSNRSQDNLTTAPGQQGRSANAHSSTNYSRQHSKDDKEFTSAGGKQSKSGMEVKSSKDTTTHFNSLHSSRVSKSVPDLDSQPASIPQGASGTSAVRLQKKSWLSSKLHLRSKPQAKLVKPNELVWAIKRDKLNKYIYESKYTKKSLQCKHKLELESGISNGPIPKLKLELHPYGLEEDRNENVTITVHVERPKHCKLHSSTEVRITLNTRDAVSGEQIGEPCTKYESIRSSYFLVKKFVSHESIKRSRCDFVEVTVEASLVDSDQNVM